MNAYVYNADLLCEDCGIRLIRRLIREGLHPEIDCRNCGFKGRIGREAARRAFDHRNVGQWISCPKCDRQAATFTDEDSDSWPQFSDDGGGEADTVWHCAEDEKCVNAHTFAGVKVGVCLENPLTSEGYQNVIQMVNEPNPSDYQKGLHAFWRGLYDIDEGYEDSTTEAADEQPA